MSGSRVGAGFLVLACIVCAAAAAALSPALAMALGAAFFVLAAALLPRDQHASGTFWWTHPAALMLLALLPGLAFSAFRDNTYFLEHWGAPKFITSPEILSVIGLAAMFAIGTVLGRNSGESGGASPGRPLSLDDDQRRWLRGAATVLYRLTVLGYVLWLVIAVARGLTPSTIVAFLGGGSILPVKAAFAPVGGVTTLVQFAAPALMALVLLRREGPDPRVRRMIIVLVALTLVRTFLRGERIALLEVAIPVFLLLLVVRRRPNRGRGWLAALPLWAPLVLIVFFGAIEYFRSWNTPFVQAQYGGRPYSAFVLDRIGAYYGTALNNGVLLIKNDHRSRPLPWYTARWFWNFPGVSSALPYRELSGSNVPADYEEDLAGQATVLFNNNSGILLPVFDLGRIGAVLFWFVAGLVAGRLFALFRRGDPVGLMVYPVIGMALTEVGRILYLTDGRALPSVVGALVVGVGLRRAKRAATAPAAVARPTEAVA